MSLESLFQLVTTGGLHHMSQQELRELEGVMIMNIDCNTWPHTSAVQEVFDEVTALIK